MILKNITIGSDPELFIINSITGDVVSSIGLIPGTKTEPYHADDMPKGFALQTDNILAEFNIPPVKTKESFINNITYMKEYIRKYVKNIDPNLDILCESSKRVPKKELQSKEAKMIGCDEDFNVYTGKPNPKPKKFTTDLRSAAIHLHIGYQNPNIPISLDIIRYFDAYIGIPSMLIDKDKERRKLYGKAGCFRITDYGLEYRVLGSYLMKDEQTIGWLYDRIKIALDSYQNRKSIPHSDDVRKCIDEYNINLCKQIILNYNM